jgi:hypothetical protein
VQLNDYTALNIGPEEALVGVEIVDARRVLGMEEPPSVTLDNLVPARDSAEEERAFLRAVYASLGARADTLLRMHHIDNLDSFLALSEEGMLRWRNAGVMTVARILAVQVRLRDAVLRAQARGEPPWSDAAYLEVLGTPKPSPSPEPVRDRKVDPDAPFPSLIAWLADLIPSENSRKAFLLRYGMLGSSPMVFREIGTALGVSRQRALQLTERAELWFLVELPALTPLVERAADLVERNSHPMGIAELTELLLVRGPQGEMLRHAIPLIRLLSTQRAWSASGLVLDGESVAIAPPQTGGHVTAAPSSPTDPNTS